MDGSKVWPAWCEGRIGDIRDYCETDVLNTYLVYLRFQHLRGQLSDDALVQEEQRVRTFLAQQQDKTHWREFLAQWSEIDALSTPY